MSGVLIGESINKIEQAPVDGNNAFCKDVLLFILYICLKKLVNSAVYYLMAPTVYLI